MFGVKRTQVNHLATSETRDIDGQGHVSLTWQDISKQCSVVFRRCVSTGLLLIAGVGVHGASGHADVYRSMLEVVGALFALISAVFLIILLACGGDSKTSPA